MCVQSVLIKSDSNWSILCSDLPKLVVERYNNTSYKINNWEIGQVLPLEFPYFSFICSKSKLKQLANLLLGSVKVHVHKENFLAFQAIWTYRLQNKTVLLWTSTEVSWSVMSFKQRWSFCAWLEFSWTRKHSSWRMALSYRSFSHETARNSAGNRTLDFKVIVGGVTIYLRDKKWKKRT